MRATVNKLYQHSKSNNKPLLGRNNLDFWSAYIAAYNVYDRFFRDKFLSWFYWIDFEDTASTTDIYNDFIEAVQAHITINSKRYAELYRVEILENSAYDIVNNYDLNETHTATRSDSATDVSGSRSDSKSGTNTLGAHTDSKTGSNIFGSHTDSKSGTNTSGEREDTQSGSATDGARQDGSTSTVGAQTNTVEKQIEGFNSSAFTDADKTIETNGARSDSTTVNKGAQTNTTSETLNKGEQTDTYSESITVGSHTDTLSESYTIGQQSNSTSETASKGEQTDTHTGSASESISIRRYGNIGVQTAADVIGGHIKLWDMFKFYEYIFDNIAKEFLLIE